MTTQRETYRWLPVVLGMVLSPAVSYGQTSALPNKPVRFIVASAPGGAADIIARRIAPKLSEALGQNVVVDNRASANGLIAAEFVAQAVADGSVIGLGNSGTHAINATLYKKLPYDIVKDFAPISEVVSASLVLVASLSLKANNMRDLIAEAKASPGKLNFAVVGATGEIAGNMIKLMGGVDIKNVPYKGSTPGTVALVSNESHLMLTPYSGLVATLESGKLKPIGVTGSRRHSQLPNVPTLAESGLDGYEVEFWSAVFAPAKTPAATVRALNREIVRVVHLPEVKQRFAAVGDDVIGSTPEQLAERVRRDSEKYRKVILESGMQRLD